MDGDWMFFVYLTLCCIGALVVMAFTLAGEYGDYRVVIAGLLLTVLSVVNMALFEPIPIAQEYRASVACAERWEGVRTRFQDNVCYVLTNSGYRPEHQVSFAAYVAE